MNRKGCILSYIKKKYLSKVNNHSAFKINFKLYKDVCISVKKIIMHAMINIKNLFLVSNFRRGVL